MTTYAIDRERLADTFTRLCEIDSPSREEGRLADYLRELFTELGADSVVEDGSAKNTGADCGNLVVHFSGNVPKEPLFYACHMDTVEPGRGVKVRRVGDIFTTAGDTVLGGDDKSGIAAVIELIRVLKDEKIPHGPIDIILTTCEEIGLLGAKNLDIGLVRAKSGYALDSTGIDKVIMGAPAANHLKIEVHGIAAHAGLNPEQGVSAFCLAARAIADLRLGRLDEQSTANFGLIKGGVATNIVPDLITIEGEVRSHSPAKLEAYTREIESTFRNVVKGWSAQIRNGKHPSVEVAVETEYPCMYLEDDDPTILRVRRAGNLLEREILFQIAGGGSDANIFNSYGLKTAIIATGMDKVHTTDECLDLRDLVSLTELLLAVAES
ncbi:peptidase T-like protein [Desulfocapsa sulfexigens DSM 10523]|uniref:Peptidase T-like protein n=1 Tax=Desulfocapsa sulfexigens (strain DSM 10523 / SB164P1) TaxID=1167006 RepID=M1PMZ5_DESSD|nr:M20/M25/M40 family metallo-hydrolase [Desulfocapsa sulfexigens]AGF77816.1 peptidase T-like protein [Desulfocapsa sulfexigens DSM 10523]